MRVKLILCLFLISLLASCAGPTETAAPTTPAPTTAAPVPQVQPVEPTMADECPICGMMPAKYPDWKAEVVMTDGSAAHFDSPKDMLKYVNDMDKMGMDKVWVEDKGTIAGIFVTDYSTKKYIDAENAHYVMGSDVQGPMGDDLIPFAEADDASAFSEEHGGMVIGYDDITTDIIKGLKGKMGGMEGMDMGSDTMGSMNTTEGMNMDEM